jgi:hypothetical protein
MADFFIADFSPAKPAYQERVPVFSDTLLANITIERNFRSGLRACARSWITSRRAKAGPAARSEKIRESIADR